MEQRQRPLKSIRTEEEHENNQKVLNNYIEELASFNKNPEKWESLLVRELESHPERADLKNRLRMISDGTYSMALENNILAHYLAEKEFENGKFSVAEFIRAFMGKDIEKKEKAQKSFRDRFAKSRADDACIAIPIDFSLQSSKSILDEMFEEYEFINIPKPEMGLVPVDAGANKIFTELREMLNECLIENGVSIEASEGRIKPINVKTPEQSKQVETIKPSKENARQEKSDERDEI